MREKGAVVTCLSASVMDMVSGNAEMTVRGVMISVMLMESKRKRFRMIRDSLSLMCPVCSPILAMAANSFRLNTCRLFLRAINLVSFSEIHTTGYRVIINRCTKSAVGPASFDQ